MALFDRVDSGFPELDEALDYFRIGDNVVYRLTELDDFRLFAEAFAKQGIKDGRNVVYVRFAEHAPLLGEMEGVTLTEIPPSKRFERFTVTLHELIQSMPEETYYIFDCLSDLQTAWSTDLLISNFFTLIGKLTEEKHAIAYFPIMRAMHSFDCMANIRDRTSVFLDVFSATSTTTSCPRNSSASSTNRKSERPPGVCREVFFAMRFVRDLRFRLPEAVQVAVLVCRDDFIAIGQGEGRLGLAADGQGLSLVSLFGLQRDPADVVLFEHRMLDGTDGDGDEVAVHFDDGNVFFLGSIDGTRNEFRHLFAAADDGDTLVLGERDDVAAMFADVEFHKIPPK